MLKVIIKRIFIFTFLLLSGCTYKNHSQAYARNEKETAYSANYRISNQHSTQKRIKTPYVEQGIASWYGYGFHRMRTSSGERYNMYRLTAAHKTLPFSSRVLVTNLANGRKVVVKINDRGPFVSNRLIDLSYAAAKKLGMLGHGTARVRISLANKKTRV